MIYNNNKCTDNINYYNNNDQGGVSFIYHDLHALVTLASCALRVATLGLTVRRPARIITGTTDGQLTILLVISFASFEI